MATKYTKTLIRTIRKGIAHGNEITKEQEEMLSALGIEIPNVEGPVRSKIVNDKIDGVLRKLTPKRTVSQERAILHTS